MSLSDRIRPNSEAAPWVCDEVKKLERELAEVAKQRDKLVRAIRKHKETTAFTLGYCDEELYKALEEIEEGESFFFGIDMQKRSLLPLRKEVRDE